MPKFEIKATHTVTYLFSIEASNLEEAKKVVMDNEHEDHQAQLIDESDRSIDSINQVDKFDWE